MTLAGVIFSGSIILNLYLIAFSGLLSQTSAVNEVVVREGDDAQKIAVVRIEGTILGPTFQEFSRQLTHAENDPNVKALVVSIDSPGGAITPSDQIFNRIRAFKQKKGAPVVVSMGFLATSGGYYAACAADHIVAEPTTWTGNIGVYMMRFDLSEAMAHLGIKDVTVAAPEGGLKYESLSKPPSTQFTEHYQHLVDSANQRFRERVIEGRGSRLRRPIDEVATGRVYAAADALADGLVDQVGYAEDAYAHAQSAAGLGNPKIVRYTKPPSVMDVLMSEGGGTPVVRGKMGRDGLELEVTREMLQELMVPQPMYLFTGR